MITSFKNKLFCLMAFLTVNLTCISLSQAQFGPPLDDRTAREKALIDISGQWVSVVNEDWRWRMITAPVGDTASVPINAEGRALAAQWDLDQDIAEGNLCRAFGAPGLIRQPTRIRVSWENDETLKFEFDAGKQTRLLHFDAQETPDGAHTLQGYSTAAWYRQRVSRGVMGGGDGSGGGSLHVQTSKLAPGYLRPNGVPYSDQAKMKEFFHTFTLPGDGDSWLIVTTIIEDPTYLTQEMVVSSQFKKESRKAGWNPRDCEIQPPRVIRPPTAPSPFG